MKTTFVNTHALERQWFVLDATDMVLGRFSTKVADILRGKNKAYFNPAHDNGDFVIIINAEKLKLTGRKMEQKTYYSHSRYPSGLKQEVAEKRILRKPEKIVYDSIAGMIPRNRIKKDILSKLKIYAGSEHPHTAQQPINLEV
jgi:large subunit ribosomal protein L13